MDTNTIFHFMQKVMFEYNFDSGVNFCGENFCRNFFEGTLFAGREKKTPAKIAKIGNRKNVVPHGKT